MANVDSDLTATNAASPLTAQSVLTVIAVNADGSPIGASGGGGVVTPNVNLASFGNQPFVPGQQQADWSMSVVIASDAPPVPADITLIGGEPVALGQHDMAHSLSVAIASDQPALAVTGTVGVMGAVTVSAIDPLPVAGTVGVSGTVPVSAADNLPVVVNNTVPVSASSPLPVSGTVGVTGTVAENLTQVGGAALALGQHGMAASLPVVIASNQSELPIGGHVSIDGTVPVSGIVGISGTVPTTVSGTVTTNVAQVGGTALTLGTKLAAASVPVVLASDQAVLPVSGTVGISGTVPVSGTVAVSSISGSVAVSGIAGTVNVAAASPLPVSGTVGISGTIPVSGSVAVTGTVAVSSVAGTVTTAGTENLTQVGGANITLGQKAASASLPVVLASDQVGALSAFAFTAGSTQVISVTNTSANTVLGAAATAQLQLANAGTQIVFVAIGTSAQTATNASYPVLPGSVVIISGNGATNLATITAQGTATLYVSRGAGL